MGHLFLINESFEFGSVEEGLRDEIFRNFCLAFEAIIDHKDSVYATNEFYIIQYSYGNIIHDFLFSEWSQIIQKPTLKGISSTTLNFFHSLIFQLPNFIKEVESKDIFNKHYTDVHHGYNGVKMRNVPDPYICCYHSWQYWKYSWLSAHQNEIEWKLSNNDFLPNKDYSDCLLFNEIKIHKQENKLSTYNGNIGLLFHEEVMRHKGPEIEAYTELIGTKIVKINYYEYLHTLSISEREACGGSLRRIFRLLNRKGFYQYISLDFRHGMFEYYDSHGKHLGEFKFDGSFNSKAEESHNLRTI